MNLTMICIKFKEAVIYILRCFGLYKEMNPIKSRQKTWFERGFQFNDLGVEISREFEIVYKTFFSTSNIEISDSFKQESSTLFSRLIIQEDKDKLCDDYFNNFTILTEILNNEGKHVLVKEFWMELLSFVKNWEKLNNETLNKGTPYYFGSVASIETQDLDMAFVLMHQALIESKESKTWQRNIEESPAMIILSLEADRTSHYLNQYLKYINNFLMRLLEGTEVDSRSYQKSRGGLLTYTVFRQKFLDNTKIGEEKKFYFSYSLFRLLNLNKLKKSIENDHLVAPVIFCQAIGGLLILFEEVLKVKYKKDNLQNCLCDLFSGQRDKGLSEWRNSEFENTRTEREDNFETWLAGHLDKNSLLGDVCIAYGLRNFAFHTIEAQKILWSQDNKVLNAIFNSLFLAIEVPEVE